MYAHLVSIGNTDISQYINESNYKMESIPVHDDWTDGRHRLHQYEYRRRVQGGFDIFCFSDTDYNTLIGLFHDNTDDEGVTTITVYVGSDINDDKEIECYATLTLEYRKIIDANRTKFKLHVGIVER
jgi:hypothetical protein